jgi:hypothetical protein
VYTQLRNHEPKLLSSKFVPTILPFCYELFQVWDIDPISWENNIFYQNLKENFNGIELEKRMILYTIYPRFDKLVSTTMGHLIKLPFSLHDETPYISFPIPRQHRNDFPLHWIPTLSTFTMDIFNESLNYLIEVIKM